jgi:hypothetical protein
MTLIGALAVAVDAFAVIDLRTGKPGSLLSQDQADNATVRWWP